ncbi:MAG TPA: DUF3499 family protein [Acidimicrobiia bacterium]|jgi:hypothetical protein|nr:DUF3499 family protein [Acidimicrobiia bacterium]
MNTGSNWARRYGPNHRRLCARPGCGTPAAATLRFEPTQREAWLVDLEVDAARTEGDLCARHAAGLVLPRGWQLHNDLVSERDESTKPAPVRRQRSASVARARRRRTATSAVELPGLSAVVDPEPETLVPVQTIVEEAIVEASVVEAPVVVVIEPDPPAPLVADASPEESEALAETLDAQTPLLRRAFANVWLPDGNPAESSESVESTPTDAAPDSDA